MLKQSVGFNGVLLGLFALVTAGVVATTHQLTRGAIAEARLRAAQAALYEIIPREQTDNDLLMDTVPVPEQYRPAIGLARQAGEDSQIHIARRQGEPFAAVIPTVAPNGYGGPIHMLLGVNRDGRIAGLRVTSHSETPGLGDGIDVKKSNWALSLNGKTLDTLSDGSRPISDPGFDQLTGATITRKAVLGQVRRTLEFFETAKPLDTPSPETEIPENESPDNESPANEPQP